MEFFNDIPMKDAEVSSGSKYHLPINGEKSIVLQESNMLTKQLVVVLDVSGSMSGHKKALEEMANASIGAGATVILFSSSAAEIEVDGTFSFESPEIIRYWGNTNYSAALSLIADSYTSASVLFMTDGQPSDSNWHSVVQRVLKNMKECNGKLSSLYLTAGAVSRSMLDVLQQLCSEGMSPKIVNAERFSLLFVSIG